MAERGEIRGLQEAFDRTLGLISLYKKLGISVPSALKGNLGEFITAMELMRKFPTHDINYLGGTFPRIDITIDETVRIQVKTQFKEKPHKYKKGVYDRESAPTIKAKTIDEDTCDIIALLILYLDEGYAKIKKKNVYIFDKGDFHRFSHVFCWTGKSKKDYTIVNILSVHGTLPPKTGEKVAHYNRPVYRKLFADSKDGWDKIEDIL